MDVQFELKVEIVTDAALLAYEQTYDPISETYTGVLALDRESLDIYEDSTIDITFQIADINNIASKNSSYSKTITLPDTANNRRVFNFISELGYDNGFNPNRKTKCYAISDSVIVFEGYIQLQNYNTDPSGFGEFDVLLTADTKNFIDIIGDTLIQDLDWEEIDLKWRYDYIQDSWDYSKTLEYFFPVIDYGWNLTAVDRLGWVTPIAYAEYGLSLMTENFYPGIYLKSYIDRIFSLAGYRYDSNFFNSDSFAKMMIPYNGTQAMQKTDINAAGTGTYAEDKYFNVITSAITPLTTDVIHTTISGTGGIPGYYTYEYLITFDDVITDPGGFWDTSANEYRKQTTETYKERFVADLEINYQTPVTHVPINMDDSSAIAKAEIRLYRSFQDQNSTTDESGWGTFSTTPMERFVIIDNTMTPEEIIQGVNFGNIPGFGASGQVSLQCQIISNFLTNPSQVNYPNTTQTYKGDAALRYDGTGVKEGVRMTLLVSTLIPLGTGFGSFSINAGNVFHNEISLDCIRDSIIDVESIIPQNVKCKDLLNGVISLFNLYIEPSKIDKDLLIIEPRDQYYQRGTPTDWTNKIDDGASVQMQLLGDTQQLVKTTVFKMKDDADYPNTNYKATYSETFGQFTYTNPSDFAVGTTNIENIFSPTPSTNLYGNSGNYIPRDVVIPNFTQSIGATDSPVYSNYPGQPFKGTNIRILFTKKQQYGEPTTTNPTPSLDSKMRFGFPYNPVPITPGPGYPYITYADFYPYAGSLDDLYAPTMDLNYDTPKGLYYDQTSGAKETQYNIIYLYWQNYLNELYNNDARIITLQMRLSPSDIANFSFANLIYCRINNTSFGLNQGSYFKVNKITEYNPSVDQTCSVELLKTGIQLQLNGGRVGFPTIPGGGSSSGGFESSLVSGGYRSPSAPIVETSLMRTLRVQSAAGTNNRVYGLRSSAVGNNNIVPNNLENVQIIGNNIIATTSNATFSSNPIIQFFNFIDAGTDEILNPFSSTTINVIDGGQDKVRPIGSVNVISQIDAHQDSV